MDFFVVEETVLHHSFNIFNLWGQFMKKFALGFLFIFVTFPIHAVLSQNNFITVEEFVFDNDVKLPENTIRFTGESSLDECGDALLSRMPDYKSQRDFLDGNCCLFLKLISLET